MKGRWAAAWAVATAVAAAFLVPAVASAADGQAVRGVTTTTPPGSPSPSPTLGWPCYDPRTPPPSSPPLTPPTAPGTPELVSAINIYVRLRWAPASDPDGLACYQVYEDKGNGTKVKVATFGPDVTEGQFTVAWPPGYEPKRIATLYVVAVDRWGADSPPSGSIQVTIYNDVLPPPSPSPSPTPTPSVACKVTYNTYDWFGGMTAYMSIANTGTTAIHGWGLTFTFPDPGQRLTSGWQADWSQTGSAVSANALSWNRDIAPGGSVTLGFTATNTGANPAPTSFKLNGATCR
ncbi:hypothetical protein Sru01_25560 [Sphaerisporangium rufum]|uniref:CBM2 domain-containing protein n=1 Tax=Sphaerisporangium rufum TaxID=1381558 RepID=A0A919R0L3_9ACTN|nr:cellulose-binding domain-containing protein [Sphaerisporangium rufum]GII77574.1 hypothetical protein Sru01_25560 [Sphaerisporangium rufum]